MENHLGPFSEAPDWPEGQEQPVWAVGGQGHLRGVTRLPSKLETWFFFKPQVFGYGKSFGTIFRTLRLTWRSRTACTGCRRSRMSSRSNSASERARDLIFFRPQVFGYGESFGTILRGTRLTWRSRTACTGCRRSRTTLWSDLTSEHARDFGFLGCVALR